MRRVAMPLRRQAVLLTLALWVPIVAGISWASSSTYREHVRQLQDQTQSTAAIVATFLDASLLGADSVAAALSLHPAVREHDPSPLQDLLPKLAGEPVLSNVFLARPDGSDVRWAVQRADTVNDQPPAAWLEQVVDGRRALISPLLGKPSASRHTLILGYPMIDAAGAVQSVLGLVVHLEAVEAVLASIPLPAGSVITITDNDGVVIARSRDSARFVGRPVTAPEAVRDVEAVPAAVVLPGADDVERAFGNSVVSRGPWLASVGIPTAVAWERTLPIYRRNLMFVAVLAIGLVAVEYFVVRRILRAFEHIDRAADRVAHGDLSTPAQHPMPSLELDRLQRTFTAMVERQREAGQSVADQVTEERRIRRELQSLQRQVIRQERLAAIGVLVSGVAHELNNPLQAILGFSELLHMRRGLPEDVKTDLTLIQKESTRASAIIRNLSRFGRQQTTAPGPVRLRDVVASVIELRQRKVEEAGIDLDVDEQVVPPVRAVFTELQQVLLNFVINAEQAILASGREPGRIWIRTFERDRRVVIEVQDSGDGVPAEFEPRLFQPFFTSKPVGEGTGLGLSVSYGIIESHGGVIGYRAAPGGGAIFFFELPVLTATEPESVS